MIKVERKGAPPRVLTDLKGAGILETGKVSDFYALKDNQEKSFTFKAYSSEEVKQGLEKLFQGKCAYCESRYAGTQPMDVEHWRPKGMIIEEDGREVRPGYYWLAAKWDNLLPSCIDCNRERHQKLMPNGELRPLGKGNRFPLRDSAKRAKAPDEESGEDPLLLHPCQDSPDEHLEFTIDAVMRPKLQSNRQPSLKGRSSIDVYALNRAGLVHERLQVLRLIQQRIRTIRQLIDVLDLRDLGPRARVVVEDLLSHEMAALRRFERPERPFCLMARQVIRKFIASLR
jgi:uncharacterized protein (TIGR02646 family)